MQAVAKPRWSTASYLVYAGAFIVLGATIGSISYLAVEYGSGALAAWALLLFAVLLGVAVTLRRQGHQLAAGVFAFVAIDSFGLFVGALWTWWGWLSNGTNGASVSIGMGGTVVERSSSTPFSGFDLGLLSLELVILIASIVTLRTFRHPLLLWGITGLMWLFVADVVSNGGNWTAVVTLVIGLVYLAIGRSLDRGPRDAYGFWFHLSAGLLIGGTLLFWWHSGDLRWALICVGALLYVALAHRARRSSWAVLGSLGFVAAATHFSLEWARGGIGPFGNGSAAPPRVWVPLVVFAFVGFLLVVLGLARPEAADAA